MDASSDLTLTATRSTSAFVTPSTSAAALTDSISRVQIGTPPASLDAYTTKQGIKRKEPESSHSGETLMPAQKKNRDYLPKESKPIFFDLKKQFKKRSQWAAHQRFITNCADTGNYPRSLQWNCTPPWEFLNQDNTRKWAHIQQSTPAELCKLIALDCDDKVKNCLAVSEALLNDLKTIIPDTDFKDISTELNHDYQLAVDRLYAEKILGRNKGLKPGPSRPVSKKQTPQKSKPSTGPRARRRVRPRTRRGTPQSTGPSDQVRSRPASNKQDLMRQLNDLTQAIKKIK